MKILNKRDFAIKINGNHYFACDYVFSNVYGDSVFSDETDIPSPTADFEISSDAKELLLDTLPETPLDALTTLPECTKEIEYMTEGTIHQEEQDDIFIRYGSDDAPMCIHIRKDGSVTLSGDEFDAAEIVFEQGKRNFIAIPMSLLNGFTIQEEHELQSPLNLCITTNEIKNNMTGGGGTLSVSYSIEVNGIVAEVSDFTLTANNIASEEYTN